MVKVCDLHAILEAVFAHVFQSRRPINQQDHFASLAHSPANGLLAQAGAKLGNGLETGNLGG